MGAENGFLFLAHRGGGAPLSMNALSLMLTRRYTATMLVNNGMAFDEVSRYLGNSSTDVTRATPSIPRWRSIHVSVA